jgi:hypothetical protein
MTDPQAPAAPEAEPAPRRASGANRILRAILTVAVFALLGPVAGAAVTIVGFVLFGFGPISFSDAGLAMLAMTSYGLWIAYPVGILPAAGVGAVVALLDAFWRETGLLIALLIGIAGGVLWALVAAKGSNRLFDALVIASCVLATLLCWWLTRPLRRLA